MNVFPHMVAAGMLLLAAAPNIADESSDTTAKNPAPKQKEDDASSEEPERVEIRIRKSEKRKNGEKSESGVSGRIVLEGPNWRKEYKLDDQLPKDFPIHIETLRGVDGARQIHGDGFRETIQDEPRYMIGIRCAHAGPVLSSHLNLDDNTIVVENVADGLPAAEAGLRKHDIILTVDGADVRGVENLISVLDHSEGKAVEIAGLRNGSEFKVSVTPQKMTSREVASATGESLADDVSALGDSEFGPRIRRRWILGPGLRIDRGDEINVEEMINEARRQARELMEQKKRDADKSQPDEDEPRQPGVQKRLQRLQRQLDELTKRLDAIEAK